MVMHLERVARQKSELGRNLNETGWRGNAGASQICITPLEALPLHGLHHLVREIL
jgi:hypothetical protein